MSATGLDRWLWELVALAVFMVKTLSVVFVIIQLRWTLPRVRVDQMMIVCWKYLVPLSLVAILGVLVLMVLVPPRGVVDYALRGVMVAVGAAIALTYVRRIWMTFMADRDLYRRMEGKPLWFPPYRLP
jgi:NADH-quinone oxidoreductase subunit H